MNLSEIFMMKDALLIRNLPKGKVFRFSDAGRSCIYFVGTGMLSIHYVTDSGREGIKCYRKSGSIFGERALMGLPPVTNEFAVAVEDSRLAVFDAEFIRHRMQQDERVQYCLLREMGKLVRRAEERMYGIMFKDMKERLYDALLEIGIDFGEADEEGWWVKKFFTHEDLARLTASSRQTVTSIMAEFKRKGLLDYDRGRYRMYDLRSREAIA